MHLVYSKSCCWYLLGKQGVISWFERDSCSQIIFLVFAEGMVYIHLTDVAWQQRRIFVAYWRLDKPAFTNHSREKFDPMDFHKLEDFSNWLDRELVPQRNDGISVTFHTQVIAACWQCCFSWPIFLCRTQTLQKFFVFLWATSFSEATCLWMKVHVIYKFCVWASYRCQ